MFTIAGAPATGHQELLVATLAHRAAAFGPSAAWLHGLMPHRPSLPHVGRCSRTGARPMGVVLHHVRELPERDLTTVDSIRTTTPTRSLLDLAAVLDDDQMLRVTARACRLGLTHVDRLIQRHLELRRRGGNGIGRMACVLVRLDPDVALLDSDLEVLLLQLLADHGVVPPHPQHPVVIDGTAYRLDFAYPEHKVAIEGDGFAFHSDREVFEHDRRRQNALVLAGWVVLRFTWRQIVREPAFVVEQVRSALDGAAVRATGAHR